MINEIILVEDSESDAEIVLRALKRANITNTVMHLPDGEKALEYFFEKTAFKNRPGSIPKLILIDLKMPKINGLELVKKLKQDETTKSIPAVVLTSSKESKDIIEAYKLGANSYLVKSADYESFSKLIVNAVYYWLMVNQPPAEI